MEPPCFFKKRKNIPRRWCSNLRIKSAILVEKQNMSIEQSEDDICSGEACTSKGSKAPLTKIISAMYYFTCTRCNKHALHFFPLKQKYYEKTCHKANCFSVLSPSFSSFKIHRILYIYIYFLYIYMALID